VCRAIWVSRLTRNGTRKLASVLGIGRACETSVPCGEAQLAPRPPVDDGDTVQAVLEREAALAKACFVDEEVLCRGVCEEEAEGLALDEEVEAHLWGASGTQAALVAGAVSVIERCDGVE